jgi:phosphoenolpyruvate carboxykinase (GTP)
MMETIKSGKFYPTLFTNVALDKDSNTPWWEGLDPDIPRPKNLADWQGRDYDQGCGKPAAHPNSRFTVSLYNCPTLSPEYDNPRGVAISAMIFGARRSDTVPLVCETFNWQHGVFMAAAMGSETTAAATHKVGVVRRDPMAMLPFCGYNMADYFAHWLRMEKRLAGPPKIFLVNWFRTGDDGQFLWPGFGDNIRVIKWIIDRIKGTNTGHQTPIGIVPRPEELDRSGLELSSPVLSQLLSVDNTQWHQELAEMNKFFSRFSQNFPEEFQKQYSELKRRLK